MVLGNAEVKITAGYKQNVIGFGWTNGVWLKMRHLIGSADCANARPAAANAEM
jgi:alpha,alpha-trehalase